MSQPTNKPLYLTFSLPTEETQFETVSAAVGQLTLFSHENGGDWQVRFRDIPNKVWIPHPMSIEGISLPCPSGIPDKKAIYRRIDVAQQPSGRVYTGEEIQTFSGYWQPWFPELTLEEERHRINKCLHPLLRPSLTQVITTAMKFLLLGFSNRSSRSD